MRKSKFYGAFVLNRRVDLHAIDATPARWRGDAGSSPLDGASTAASSPRNDLVKNFRVHPTHCLISTQVEAMLAAKTRMEGSVSRGAASRHPWIEPRNCEPPAPGNDAGEVVAWCRAVGEALNSQQLAAHDAVKHAHHQVSRGVLSSTRRARMPSIRLGRRCFPRRSSSPPLQRPVVTHGHYCRETFVMHCAIP